MPLISPICYGNTLSLDLVHFLTVPSASVREAMLKKPPLLVGCVLSVVHSGHLDLHPLACVQFQKVGYRIPDLPLPSHGLFWPIQEEPSRLPYISDVHAPNIQIRLRWKSHYNQRTHPDAGTLGILPRGELGV